MVPPSPEHGALDRAWRLWVLTALAATVAAAWAVWFASGHASGASATATAIRAASSPTLRPVCSLDFRDARVGETDWSVATTSPTTLTIARFTVESANLGGPDGHHRRLILAPGLQSARAGPCTRRAAESSIRAALFGVPDRCGHR